MPHITKIYGPPGTGKTTWMLNRLDQELREVPLEHVAYVTFSVAAREEAVGRAQSRLVATKDQFRFFKTIHGICYAENSMAKANVMQTEDYLDFSKKTGIKFSDDFTDEYDIDGLPRGWGKSIGNQAINVRQTASARKIDPLSKQCRLQDWPMGLGIKELTHILSEYATYKSDRSKFDFVDMLEMYAVQGEALPIDVMFVDEAQDLSALQWDLVSKMSANAKRVYIAGDDDQSIYGFLGADPVGFYRHHCDDKIILPKSYRLRQNIWNAAASIINPVKEREMKHVEVRADGGEIERWNRPPEEVLARTGYEQNVMMIANTNYQLAGIASRLEHKGIPVTRNGTSLVGSRHAKIVYDYHIIKSGEAIPAKDAIAILRLVGGDYKALADRARLEGRLMMERDDLAIFGVKFERNWVDYLSNGKQKRGMNDNLDQIVRKHGVKGLIDKPKVELTTYHAAKGREADTVILVSDCSPATYFYGHRNPDNERRVGYVGVTRAKEKLIVISPQTNDYMRTLHV